MCHGGGIYTNLQEIVSPKKRGKKKSPSFPAGFLANHIAARENVLHLMMSAICGGNILESFAKLTHGGSWLKMYGGYCQVSMDDFSDVYCETWPDGGGAVWWYCFPARAFGAPFIGDRVAIVAAPPGLRGSSLDVNKLQRPDKLYLESLAEWQARQSDLLPFMARPNTPPKRRSPRNDDGLTAAMDRYRAIGNCVVPYQFYPIFKLIADIEESYEP